MPVWFYRVKQIHYFLVGQALYPVLLSTFLTGGLFVARAALISTWGYRFLPWNLFLAWIPYLSSLVIAYLHQHHPKRWGYLLIPSLLWLTFFPNAPYIITDFIHLRWRYPVPIWYDIVLLAMAAWTGLFLAAFSLRTMQQIVKTFLGTVASWLFVALVMGLSGLGIYLGRFLRWNSWDLLLRPDKVLSDIALLLIAPFENLTAFGFIIQISAFLLVCYLTLTPTSQKRL